MVTKELSEAAVEFNCILNYVSDDILSKIPEKFIQFLKEIESKTYKFEYDKSKSLNNQNLKMETRGLIAQVYQDYLCDENQKIEYIELCNKFYLQKEMEKREKYNPNNIFKNNNIKKSNNNNHMDLIEIKDNFFSKLIKNLKKFFGKI